MKGLDCIYCGKRKSTKRGDHIPPESLYPKPRKPNLKLHAVPSCKECNNPASRDDEVFKVVIGLDTAETRTEKNDLLISLKRTLKHNKRIYRELNPQKFNVHVDGGEKIVDSKVKLELEYLAYRNVVQRMVRGLYWRETNKIMSEDSLIHVSTETDGYVSLWQAQSFILEGQDSIFLNDGTFMYKVLFTDNGETIWSMRFFEKHLIHAYSESNEHNKVN